MHESSRARLIEIVDFAQNEIKDLLTHQKLDYKTYRENKDIRRLVERMIENITNAIIDIFKILINEKGQGLPDSYAGIMEQGATLLNLEDSRLKHLIQVAKLRNILAHEYLDLKWDKIKKFMDEYQITVGEVLARTSRSL